MSLSSPLTLAQFAELTHYADAVMTSTAVQEYSSTGGSDDLYADLSVPRWSLSITTQDLSNQLAEMITARYNWLVQTQTDFMMFNARAKYPATDPDGTLLGASSVSLGTIADAFHTTLAGLPPGFVLPAGTYFQVTFDTSRTYLGQLIEDATAGGGGTTGSVSVAPGLPASVAGGDVVQLLKPAARFRMQSNTLSPSTTSGTTRRLQMTATQTYSQ